MNNEQSIGLCCWTPLLLMCAAFLRLSVRQRDSWKDTWLERWLLLRASAESAASPCSTNFFTCQLLFSGSCYITFCLPSTLHPLPSTPSSIHHSGSLASLQKVTMQGLLTPGLRNSSAHPPASLIQWPRVGRAGGDGGLHTAPAKTSSVSSADWEQRVTPAGAHIDSPEPCFHVPCKDAAVLSY